MDQRFECVSRALLLWDVRLVMCFNGPRIDFQIPFLMLEMHAYMWAAQCCIALVSQVCKHHEHVYSAQIISLGTSLQLAQASCMFSHFFHGCNSCVIFMYVTPFIEPVTASCSQKMLSDWVLTFLKLLRECVCLDFFQAPTSHPMNCVPMSHVHSPGCADSCKLEQPRQACLCFLAADCLRS